MRPGVNNVMLQRRAAVELLVLATSTAMFLLLLPSRPLWMNMGLALLALALVGISARETRGRFWGSPAGDWRSRQRRSAELVLGPTLPVVVAFGTFAAAGVEPRSVDAIVARLFGPGFSLRLRSSCCGRLVSRHCSSSISWDGCERSYPGPHRSSQSC